MLAIVQPWHTPRVLFLSPDCEMFVETEGATSILIAYATLDQSCSAQEKSWVQNKEKYLRVLNEKYQSYRTESKDEVSKTVRTKQKSLLYAKRPRKARLEVSEVAEIGERAGAANPALPAICDRERASSSQGDAQPARETSHEDEKTGSTTSTELELSSRSRSACSLQPMQKPEATRTRGDVGLWNNCIWP